MLRTRSCVLGFSLLFACAGGESNPASETEEARNLLLICVDDLRPELGCYGADHVQSPALDAFAAEALRFDRHYALFPTCGASRFAFLTGRRPSETRHYGNSAFGTLKEDSTPERLPLPNAFRAAGYRTVCLGKISHSHNGLNDAGDQEIPGAWDETPTDAGPWKEAKHLLHGYSGGRKRDPGISPITEAADVGDLDYPDGRLANQAIEQLRRLAATPEPFLLAVGFFKPHLPFAAPKRYWDLYDPDALPLSKDPLKPTELPAINGWAQSGEVTGNYSGAGYEDKHWSEQERRHLRHGYFACVSYVDAQVGRLLDELAALGLESDTLVVVWGDHGWHLGDQGLFGKHTTFEAALRSTLLMRVPGMGSAGQGTQALVESIDVYPTLAELCSVEFPAGLPGQSFAALLLDSTLEHRREATSYWRRGPWFAESTRTRNERRVEWVNPEQGKLGGVETYRFAAVEPE
ncbi:MAG: arylsulfatase A-like enzyme [Candidatus Paceibacteria bacterium]|jgi:arylsulfatase A-like enzyme